MSLIVSNENSVLLSVIIPCFNDGKYLPKAIKSLGNASGSIYELRIVDDGSTYPFTLEVLKELLSYRFKLIHQEHRGGSAALNLGLENSKGDSILPLDATI